MSEPALFVASWLANAAMLAGPALVLAGQSRWWLLLALAPLVVLVALRWRERAGDAR